MSKTERRKFFQPIPLSSILDPTYQSPFSKLEKFQVDMEISSKRPQQTVWQKLQSSLLSAMSNFVIMSSTAMSQRTAPSMSLVPWKSFKPCELLISEEVPDSIEASSPSSQPTKATKLMPEKSTSLYYSVRSGLQCLRYLATHPLQSEDNEFKRSTQTQTPTRHYYDCRKLNNIVVPAVGYPIAGGGALFFPLISTTDSTSRYSLSAPTSPSHHYHHQTLRPVVSNLFSWAMSGFPLSTPLHHRHLTTLYKNYCLFSPIQTKGAEINTTMLCPQKSLGSLESISSPCKSAADGNIEIFIHSSSTASQDIKSGKNISFNCSSSGSPAKSISLPNSPARTSGIGNTGCIRIETNWKSLNDESNSSSRTNIHHVSVCSSSSSLGGAYAFSCTSAMSACPRSMMTSARSGARRFPTESESSVDSFVEFSASVESTDSFCIVFESASSGCIGEEDTSREEEDEEWEDDDDDDENESDDEDQIFNHSSASEDIFVDGFMFQVDGIDAGEITSCDQVDRCADRTIHGSRRKKKTVSFDEEHLENICEFEDDAESKNSRETFWEMLARDRARFQDRILRTGDILEPILLPSHRHKIFQQRFVNAGDN